MSEFVDTLLGTARESTRGLVTGEPDAPVRESWSQVHRKARAVAGALVDGGLRPGGAVAVLAAEPALIAPAVQGVWLSGGSVTMLHQPTARTDLAEWAQDTLRVLGMIDAHEVLLSPSFAGVASTLAEHGVRCREITELESASTVDDSTRAEPVPVADGDTALLQLTSGTTAAPKAVRITHGNLLANIRAIAGRGKLDPARDVMVSWLPLFHDMGMVCFLTLPMTLGLELVKITPVDFLSAPLLWPTLLSKYGATITGAPNFGYALLRKQFRRVDDPAAYDLSPLRIALNGAEPIDESVTRGFLDAGARFGLRPECVLAAYGMAEATLAVSAAPLGTGLRTDEVDVDRLERERRAEPATPGDGRHLGRLGKPLPGLEVRVVDGQAVLGEREIGELQVRGDAVTPGYLTLDGPEPTQDADGWLHTGDLGYLAEGDVVICGRIKDVIIMAGRNIYPTDLELAVGAVDGVRAGNAAAVRLDAGTRRETFAIVVESKFADDSAAAEALAERIERRVVESAGVRPAQVRVLVPGSLPKTPSGKLRRAAAARHLTPAAATAELGTGSDARG